MAEFVGTSLYNGLLLSKTEEIRDGPNLTDKVKIQAALLEAISALYWFNQAL